MKSSDNLTDKEQLVLSFAAQGWHNAKIAHELFISRRTVENHLYHIFEKFGVSSRTQAIFHALNNGLLNLDVHKNPNDAVNHH